MMIRCRFRFKRKFYLERFTLHITLSEKGFEQQSKTFENFPPRSFDKEISDNASELSPISEDRQNINIVQIQRVH